MNYITASETLKSLNNPNLTKNVKLLQNGSNVRVTIVKDNGNGSYEGSVAGVKVRITSKNPMLIGKSFTAKVNYVNNQIQLLPEKKSESVNIDKFIIQSGESEIYNLLSEFGIENNELSETVLLQLKQLGLPFEKDLIKSILSKAAKAGNKKISAASLIAILKSKGIELTEENLESLLKELNLEGNDEKFKGNLEKSDEFRYETENIFIELNNFKNEIFNGSLKSKNKEGALTVLNQLSGKSKKIKNWIMVPFNITNLENKIYGSGNIKFLLNEELDLEKLLLSYNAAKSYYFLLDYKDNKIDLIKVYISESDEKTRINLLKKLSEEFSCSKIYWSEERELKNTAAATENIVSIGGLI